LLPARGRCYTPPVAAESSVAFFTPAGTGLAHDCPISRG
jgi:hypothetical protein